jgi:hypothetical protein
VGYTEQQMQEYYAAEWRKLARGEPSSIAIHTTA